MKKPIKIIAIVTASIAVIFLAFYIFCLIAFNPNIHFPWEEDHIEVSYGNRDFVMSSWGVFPHAMGYKLHVIEDGKKIFLLEGLANNDAVVEFQVPWENDGCYYARYFGDYLRIDERSVEVFNWQTSIKQREQFIDYFYWILDTQSFWSRHSVAWPMYSWWSDEKALVFVKRIVEEAPDSVFFPRDTTDDYWWDNHKKYLEELISKKTANQQVDPTVKTPVESGNEQGTAGHP